MMSHHPARSQEHMRSQTSGHGAIALILAAIGLSLSELPAQSFHVPSNTPTSGACNLAPFGDVSTKTWGNQVCQLMCSTKVLGGAGMHGRISDIGFAACFGGVRHFDTIEVVLAQTKASSLSTTFSRNLVSNVKTVLKAKNYDWHLWPGIWNRLGIDKDYDYIAMNGNLVVQITVTGARSRGPVRANGSVRRAGGQRVLAYNWTGKPPSTGKIDLSAPKIEVQFRMNDLHQFGFGCSGYNGVPTLTLYGSAKLGTNLIVGLTKAVPRANLFHIIALSRLEPPIDLIVAGAPYCMLYLPPTVVLTAKADSSGAYWVRMAVPMDGKLLSARVYTQFFPFDSSKKLGLTASNYGRILLGN